MAGISQQIDSRVSVKVAEYIKEGVTTVAEIRQLVKIFVKSDVFGSESQNNRRYYPGSRVICSLMYRKKKTLRKSRIDQECLIDKIEQ